MQKVVCCYRWTLVFTCDVMCFRNITYFDMIFLWICNWMVKQVCHYCTSDNTVLIPAISIVLYGDLKSRFCGGFSEIINVAPTHTLIRSFGIFFLLLFESVCLVAWSLSTSHNYKSWEEIWLLDRALDSHTHAQEQEYIPWWDLIECSCVSSCGLFH